MMLRSVDLAQINRIQQRKRKQSLPNNIGTQHSVDDQAALHHCIANNFFGINPMGMSRNSSGFERILFLKSNQYFLYSRVNRKRRKRTKRIRYLLHPTSTVLMHIPTTIIYIKRSCLCKFVVI